MGFFQPYADASLLIETVTILIESVAATVASEANMRHAVPLYFPASRLRRYRGRDTYIACALSLTPIEESVPGVSR